MNINENTAIVSYYNYYTGPNDTTASQYELVNVTLQTNGSAFAIKGSDASYSILESSSSLTVSSDILLACATDMTSSINITWYYTSTIGSTSGEIIIPNTDARVSLNTTTGISTLFVPYNNSGEYICRVAVNSGSTDEYIIYINVTDNIILAEFGVSYDYYYGVDDGTARYICSNGTWRQAAGGDNTQHNYTHPSGALIIFVLLTNDYIFVNYTLTCVNNGENKGTIYLNIIDASSTNISYSTPQYSAVLTGASSTVAIPPLAQNITISCVTDGCTWGGRERSLIPDYTISVMNINENTAIVSYYNYYTGPNDTIARQYELVNVTLQANGSAFAIKLSVSYTTYTMLQSNIAMNISSDTLLACATDMTASINITWYYTSTIGSTNGETIIPNTDARVSLNTTTGISTLLVSDNTTERGKYICRVAVNSGDTDEYIIYINTPVFTITTTAITTTTTPATTTTTPTTTTPAPTTPATTATISSASITTIIKLSQAASSSSLRVTNHTNTSTMLSSSQSISTTVPGSTAFSPIIIIIIPIIIIIVLAIIIITFIVLIVLCLLWIKKRRDKRNDPSYAYVFNNSNYDNNIPIYSLPIKSSERSNTMQSTDQQLTVDSKYEIVDSTLIISKPDTKSTDTLNINAVPIYPGTENVACEDNIYYSYNDPATSYNDKAIPIPYTQYKLTLDSLWKNECSELNSQYEGLGLREWRSTCNTAQLEENYIKNRFKEIYPYDQSRVILRNGSPEQGADYINASHIPGVYVEDAFIAAMGPKDCTVNDFWEMIFEQNVANIVMLTNLFESGKKKCALYWPQEVGSVCNYGPLQVTLESEKHFYGYVERRIEVCLNESSKNVTQFHFIAWPDHDIPDQYDQLIYFVNKVRNGRILTNAPICVHCSAGIGRTGTFIALYNLMEYIRQEKPISIYHVVNEMRNHRPQMVQTFSQYKFIYLAVLEIIFGQTGIPSDEFPTVYEQYMESDRLNYQSVFLEQFNELNYQSEKSIMTSYVATRPENAKKNPIATSLPYDSTRVDLTLYNNESAYINATHISIDYIVTLHPTSDTLTDFIRLLYQTRPALLVMLTTPDEKNDMLSGRSDRKAYWPLGDKKMIANEFTVKCNDTEDMEYGVKQELTITNTADNTYFTITQMISEDWDETGQVTDSSRAVQLIDCINSIQNRDDYNNRPIIVHCTDAIGKSGVLLTLLFAIKELKNSGRVDIFQAIKSLRNKRRNIVPTIAHFNTCYAILSEYCKN